MSINGIWTDNLVIQSDLIIKLCHVLQVWLNSLKIRKKAVQNEYNNIHSINIYDSSFYCENHSEK